MEIKIIKNLLPEFEYFKEPHKKNQIVLHHTVSSVGKYVADWFKADKGKSKIAVAYVIEKNGDIYQLFDPQYWAYHIGKGSNTKDNAHSIAIEVVNEGALINKDKKFYWFDGKYEYKGKVVELDKPFRGFNYFASYTDEQVEATHLLLKKLIKEFNITPQFSNTFEFDERFRTFNGVVMHVNLRKDKTDLSPAWNLSKTNEFIKNILENYGKEYSSEKSTEKGKSTEKEKTAEKSEK